MPSNVLPLHLKQIFLPINWIFTEDGLPFKNFSTLLDISLLSHKKLSYDYFQYNSWCKWVILEEPRGSQKLPLSKTFL